MLFWTGAIAIFFLFLRELGSKGVALLNGFQSWQDRKNLKQVVYGLLELEECLGAGWVPSEEQWEGLRSLPDPWGGLAYESLREIRAGGGALLPTLKRLRALGEEQSAVLGEVSSKLAQAYLQSLFCFVWVPLLGFLLYEFLPGVKQQWVLWSWGCGGASLLCGAGVFWLMRLGVQASWGGLLTPHRSWPLGAHCAGERFLALIRVGHPPDIAWMAACDFLSQWNSRLAQLWGYSVWDVIECAEKANSGPSAEALFIEAGQSIKKAVQASLMEGRPCIERVETLLAAMSRDFKARINQSVSLLGTHALKPLFLFVAPALLGLLSLGLWLAFLEVAKEGFLEI